MHKATITFNLTNPDEKRELQKVLNIYGYEFAISDLANQLFRPARKHGYSASEISNADELNQLLTDSNVQRAIELLEEEFYAIINTHNVNPNE